LCYVIHFLKTLLLFQVKESKPVTLDALPIEEDVEEFEGPTSVGGLFQSVCAENAASYFSGYLARKTARHHQKVVGTDFFECEGCDDILAPQDLSTHLFLSFKEYQENVNSS